MTQHVNINGSNRVSRNCITANINGSNHASIIASQWVSINGSNHSHCEGPSVTINGSNHGIAKGNSVEINGSNHGQIFETGTLTINGSNWSTANAMKASVQNNVRGGCVIAGEITYAGLRMDYHTITEMAVGQVITREFFDGTIINGRRQTVTVTLTRKGQNEWNVEARGVTNELTVLSKDRLAKNYQLQLRHLFGEPRATVISGGGVVSGGGSVTINGVTFSGGNVTIRSGRRSRWGW